MFTKLNNFRLGYLRCVSIVIIAASLLAEIARAQNLRGSGSLTTEGIFSGSGAPNSQAQYVYRPIADRQLIPVYILGAVKTPGTHYIPTDTSLLNFLALTGGPLEKADTERILIRRSVDNRVSNDTVDLAKIMELQEPMPYPMRQYDMVFVPQKQPIVDDDTAKIIGISGAIASLILSSFVIYREISNDQGK